MSDELLAYYNRELAFIRKLGAEFAQVYPKVAGRLAWSGEGSEDPHVSRMIQAFALLSARTRRKIEDEFPEITEAMLGILYPHYLSPTPSCAIIQARIDRSQAQLTSGYQIARGSTIDTDPIDGLPVQFQTCYDLQLWPIEPAAASYHGEPFAAPATRVSSQAEGVVRIELKTLSPEAKFDQMQMRSLRFYIASEGQYAYDLYELLLNNAIGVAVAASADDPNAVELGKKSIQPVGFDRSEGLLDYTPQSFLGYRLLTEFFSFPQKFLFFEITGFSEKMLAKVGKQNRLELFIFVNRHAPDLQQQVSADTFRLGCTPMVNLYRQCAEPIRCKHTTTEHHIVPDARCPSHHEVYRVQRVIGTTPKNEEIEFAPFYSTRHGDGGSQPRAFWHATRRRMGYAGGKIDYGTEVLISLVDLDFQPAELSDWTIDVETLCVSRDLPRQLPFGGGQPKLQLGTGGSLARVECLTRPTPTYRPALREQTMWRLVSHLSLNHLSLVDTERGAEALREILRLYDPANSEETRALVDGLQNLSTRRVVGRVGGPVAAGFCRGLEVTLHLDEEKYTGSGVYLFASVLERFLGLYSSLNSFTKTVVKTDRRPNLCSWPPRAGEQVLI